MLELLISLALIVGMTYYMMSRKIGTKPDPSLKTAQKRLDAQGIQVPAQINLARPNDTAQAVGAAVEQISGDHERNLDCATGEGNACSINGGGNGNGNANAGSSANSAAQPASTPAPH